MNKQTSSYNFNAGPSALPLDVLHQAQQDLVDYKGSGMSIMEMSHRSTTYENVHNEAIHLIKELLNVPEDYHVLFLQGGASLQFSMIPMNFLSEGQAAAYLMTGSWSEKALKEAQLIGDAFVAATTKKNNYKHIPSVDEISLKDEPAYMHITSNNTIFGTQWSTFPEMNQAPLIADMSSDILSKPLDINQFSMIYAGAQKNLGPSGVTLVIIHKDMVDKEKSTTPTLLKYSTHVKSNSLYHTPPTFSIYMLGLVMNWIKQQGGVQAIHKLNQEKAHLIYDVIDSSNGFYYGHAQKESRSLMNITFRLKSEDLENKFLEQAEKEGFVGLSGHRSVGGCRASIYNSVPLESCQALKEFMLRFQNQNS